MNTKKIILILLLPIYCFSQKKDKKFSKKEILTDLTYLYESLEDAHYNLYAYTSKKAFKKNFCSIQKSITKDSLNTLEATSLFQKIISKANNGHTEIDFPVQPYLKYGDTGGTLFPLEIAFENNKALIRKNWSKNNNIKKGAEVLEINGESISQVLYKIQAQTSAERTYFKNAKIELYSFPRYYWQVYGKKNQFVIKIKSDNKIQKHTLKTIKVFEEYEMKRLEVLNAKMTLKFFKNTAYINPGNFSGDKQKYQHFLDSSFLEIKRRKSNTLIIDLKNNGGGHNFFSDYLVSYFADKPFKWNSSFTLKTSKFLKENVRKNRDTTDVFWKEVLKRKDGEIYDYEFNEKQPKPKNKRFTGKVYVLINRQSHSQSAVTAAQIQDYNFGTIIGEETGDYPTLYASQFQYPLPNTGIIVKVSKGLIVRVNGSKKQEGVIPDIYIQDHLLDEEDEILNGLLKKMKEN